MTTPSSLAARAASPLASGAAVASRAREGVADASGARGTLRFAAWLGAAQAATGVLAVALVVLLAARVAPAQFGMWQVAVAASAYLVVLSVMGTSQLGTWTVAREGGASPVLLRAWALARARPTALVLGACAAGFLLLPGGVEERLLVTLVPVAAVARSWWPDWLLQGLRRGRALALVTILFPVANLALVAIVVTGPETMHRVGMVSLATAVALGAAAWAWAVRALRQGAPAGAPLATDATGVTDATDATAATRATSWSREARPLGLAALTVQVAVSADVILVGILATGLAAAHYAAAMTAFVFVNGLSAAFHAAVFPAISRALASGEGAGPLTRRLIPVGLGAAIPVAILLAGNAHGLVELAYGPAYRPAGDALRILAVQVPISMAGGFAASLLVGAGRRVTYLRAFVAGGVFNITANILVIPVLGPPGAALVSVATSALIVGAMWVAARGPGLVDPRPLAVIGTAALAMTVPFLAGIGPLAASVLGCGAYAAVVAIGSLWLVSRPAGPRDWTAPARDGSRPRDTSPGDPARPRLLFLMHVDWDWIKQRPHHLAERLDATACDVLVLYVPAARRGRLRPNPSPVRRRPLVLAPRRSLAASRAVNRWLGPVQVRAAIRAFRPTHLLLTSPELRDALPSGLDLPVHYDCLDLAEGFAPEGAHRSWIRASEARLLAGAASVSVTSEALRRHVSAMGAPASRVVLVRNGVDTTAPLPLAVRAAGARSRDRHVAYVGTISDWLDTGLLLRAAEALPDVTWHFWGPEVVRLPAHPRFRSHGTRARDELPGELAGIDAFVMPFILGPLIGCVDPVKLYEYLGWGRPVVSVFYEELRPFEGLVGFYADDAGFVRAVRAAVDGEASPDPSAVRSFLEGATWDRRAATLAGAMLA